jgi:outer membrane protein TolC
VTALHNLGKMASLLRHDLYVRQRQAALGVVAAEARLRQAEVETLYSVTRLYWTAVYATNQLSLVETALSKKEGAADSLYTLRKNLETLRRKRQKEDVWLREQFSSITTVAEGRKVEAEQGVQRALAALREAIGLEPGCPLAVKDKELPEPPAADVTRAQIVTLALEHRAEIAQAGTAAEVAGLEVEAQYLIKGARAETFATGSDLHAQPLPAASFGEDYRPAAVGVEMPATLVGPPCQRTEQARLLHERTLAVVAKTRGLVALEAEDAYLRWVESRDRLPSFKQAQEEADRALKSLLLTIEGENGKDTEPRASKATLSDVLIASVRRIMTRVEYDQARLRLVLNFAALERVTGGGFCPVYSKPENGSGKDAGTGDKKD